MSEKEDLNFSILLHDGERRMFVDQYEDSGVWLSLSVKGGSAYCSMTIEQAEKVVDALQRVIEAQKAAA